MWSRSQMTYFQCQADFRKKKKSFLRNFITTLVFMLERKVLEHLHFAVHL